MPWSRAMWGWGEGGYSVRVGDEPWCGCPKRGVSRESESAPVSASVPLGASVSAPTPPRCSESHESPPGWFTEKCEVKAGAAVPPIMPGPAGATQVLKRTRAILTYVRWGHRGPERQLSPCENPAPDPERKPLSSPNLLPPEWQSNY